MITYAETNAPKQSRVPLNPQTPHFATPSMEEILASRCPLSVEIQHQPAFDSPLQYTPDINNPQVAQLLSIQIRSTQGRITQVVVRGRPPHVHGASMGDHITAFATHAEAINIALTNRTPIEAIPYISHITESLCSFNINLLEQVPERMNAFQEELGTVRKALSQIAENPYFDLQIDLLQQAIAAYLNARELIPFNTVNVACLSANAGKGHGESQPLEWLSMFERGKSVEMEDTDGNSRIIEAAIQLLDIHAVMLLAVQEEPKVRTELTAGIQIDGMNWEDWTKYLIETHFNTLCTLFPNIIEPFLNEQKGYFFDRARQAFFAESQKMTQHLNELKEKVGLLEQSIINRINLISLPLPPLKQIQEALTIYEEERNIIDHLNRLHTWIPILMREEVSEVTMFAITVKNNILSATQQAGISPSALIQLLKSSGRRTTQKSKYLLRLIVQGEPLSNPTLLRFHAPSETVENENIPFLSLDEESELSPEEEDLDDREWLPEEEDIDESDDWENMEKEEQTVLGKGAPTLISQTPSMSIQLLLKDGVIWEMRSDGRPPSPYSNTMGAHTTAWIVHLDRIRRLIVSLNPENALACLCKCAQEDLIEIRDMPEELRDQSTWKNQEEQLTTLLNNIESQTETDGFLSTLQDFIYNMLAILNLRPGVSVNKSNTRGHGEGTSRTLLYQAEWYDPLNHITPEKAALLNIAVDSLFDGAVRNDNDRYIQHLAWVAEAYPRVYTALQGVDPEPPTFVTETETGKLPDSEESQTVEEGNPDDASTSMSEEEILMSTNNCLIHAIHEAADGNRATVQDIMTIRQVLHIAPGEPIAADQQNLTTILTALNINAHVIVGTPTANGEMDIDEAGPTNAPILLIHFNPQTRHFTSIDTATPIITP